jgi:hypothetical protein
MKGILSVTWWRLFWASPDEGYFESHLMKAILSVTGWRVFWASPDEGYFERPLMKGILSVTWWRVFWASPDEGYFERHLMKGILSVPWWRVLQKRVVCSTFDIYVIIIIFYFRVEFTSHVYYFQTVTSNHTQCGTNFIVFSDHPKIYHLHTKNAI